MAFPRNDVKSWRVLEAMERLNPSRGTRDDTASSITSAYIAVELIT